MYKNLHETANTHELEPILARIRDDNAKHTANERRLFFDVDLQKCDEGLMFMATRNDVALRTLRTVSATLYKLFRKPITHAIDIIPPTFFLVLVGSLGFPCKGNN